ncbi:aldo/keto reductase [Candidatus Saccharibacteria bacterium]|nr:aldo/keto reductase [Candidatus Saccharibacteria bacterium]
MEHTELNNGIKMPTVGIGVFTFTPEEAEKSVEAALKSGYHLVDTANAYMNERGTGRGIKNSGVKREDVFVSTKLWPTEYENPNAIDETLERLGLDYIDLLFLHQPAGNWQAGYKMLEKAYKDGKIKAIGISNFEGKYLDELLSSCEIVPQVMQVECHPYFTQKETRAITDPKGIKIMCWFPLGHGDKSLVDEPIFAKLAEKYGKSPAQIILKWHNQMGFIVIPGSRNPEHIKENADIFDFELTDEEMAEIAKLDKGVRYYEGNEGLLNQYLAMKPEYEKE